MLLFTALFSQEGSNKMVRVTGVKGECEVAGSLTVEQAEARALANAKKNALISAGVVENIQAYDLLQKGESGEGYFEYFMSQIQSDVSGGVCEYSVAYTKEIVDNSIAVIATIDASVVRYDVGRDPKFSVQVDGIKQGYQNGESMTYTVKPSINCYLKIFNLFNNKATIIFPNQYEPSIMLRAGVEQKFPFSDMVDSYYMEKLGDGAEHNRFLFVFTKEEISYVDFKMVDGEQQTTLEHILQWFYRISPDKRVNEYHQFTIY